MLTLKHFFSLGWDDGVYSEQKLNQADHLLPLQEEISTPSPLETSENSNSKSETEPSSSLYQQLNIRRQENICNCIFSTKSSSLTVDKDLKSICTCNVDYDKQRSIMQKKESKERHMSVDSARDSGIGENSNLTDVEEHPETGGSGCGATEDSLTDLRGFWQPKVKRSLVDRLPPDSFYLIPPSRYIYPGAEVYYDPDEKLSYEDSSSDSQDSESECENVEAAF